MTKPQAIAIVAISVFILLFSAAGAVVIKNDFRVNNDTTSLTHWTPEAGFDSSGNFVIVWAEFGEDYGGQPYWRESYFQRFNAQGDPLGEPVLFSDTTSYFYNALPSIAVHPDGHFVIAWEKSIQVSADPYLAEEDIWVQVFDNQGVPLTPKTRVDLERPSVLDDNLAYDTDPSVSLDSFGNFVIVWNTQDNTGHGVWGQLFDSSATRIDNNFWISNPEGSPLPFTPVAQFPKVRMHPDGRFIVTWLSHVAPPFYNLMPAVRIYNADGSPKTPMLGLFPIDAGLSLGNDPDVALGPNGTYIFAWNGNDVGFSFPDNAVYTQVLDSNLIPLGPYQVIVDTDRLGDILFFTRVRCASDGSYIVLWSDRRSGDRDLFAQKCDASGYPIGVNYRINSIPGSLMAYGFFGSIDALWYMHWLDIHDDKVLFVWSDFRNYDASDTDFDVDVYAKLMEVNDIGTYVPGDLNMDRLVTLSDVMMLVNHLFKGTYPKMYPKNPADVNRDCLVSLADVINMVNYLFKPPWELNLGCVD